MFQIVNWMNFKWDLFSFVPDYFILTNPAYTDARKLLLLARHSLLATMRSRFSLPFDIYIFY